MNTDLFNHGSCVICGNPRPAATTPAADRIAKSSALQQRGAQRAEELRASARLCLFSPRSQPNVRWNSRTVAQEPRPTPSTRTATSTPDIQSVFLGCLSENTERRRGQSPGPIFQQPTTTPTKCVNQNANSTKIRSRHNRRTPHERRLRRLHRGPRNVASQIYAAARRRCPVSITANIVAGFILSAVKRYNEIDRQLVE